MRACWYKLAEITGVLTLCVFGQITHAQSAHVDPHDANALVGNSKGVVTPNTNAPVAPAPAAPAKDAYTVGYGDVLNVSVWKERDLSPTVTVRPDGKISIPLIGELLVTGMTPSNIEQLLKTRLTNIVVDPRVTVTVTEIHSRLVYITGEVARPGAYPLNSPLNLLQLIAQAGGLTQFASRKKITLITPNSSGPGVRFDYNQLVKSANSRQNLWLTPGSTVIVP